MNNKIVQANFYLQTNGDTFYLKNLAAKLQSSKINRLTLTKWEREFITIIVTKMIKDLNEDKKKGLNQQPLI